MNKLRYILGTSLLLPTFILTPVLVRAETGTDNTTETTKQTTVQTTVATTTADSTETEDDSTKPSTDPTTRKKRLDDLKASLKITLDEKTKKVIVAKCKPAQTIVEKSETNDKDNWFKRENAYKNITNKLNALVDKLKVNNIDTTALDAAITALDEKVTVLKADMDTYEQAMTDLRALDCATDPIAFKTALTAARTDREKVRADALAIRTVIKETVKPALETIKAQLKAQKTQEDTSGDNQ